MTPSRTVFRSSARVVQRAMVGPHHCRLRLHAPRVAAAARPGQFVHVHTMDHGTLRRPISIHRIPTVSAIEILFKVVGEGTAMLTRAAVGDEIDILGPTGTGFHIGDDVKAALLVAGGVGAAPLVSLWDALARRPVRATFLLGAADRDAAPLAVAATREAVPGLPKVRPSFLSLKGLDRGENRTAVVLERGESGYRGLVTDLAAPFLRDTDVSGLTVYACGPRPMLAAVARLCADEHVACQVSLEQRMGCGLGACMGCAVPVRADGGLVYKRACVDGPVFDAADLEWEAKW